MRFFLLMVFVVTGLAGHSRGQTEPALAPGRERLLSVLLAEPERQATELRTLIGVDDEMILPVMTAWRQGELFIHVEASGRRIPFLLSTVPDGRGGFAALSIADGKPIRGADGQPLSLQASGLTPLDTDGAIRRAMRDVTELAGLSAPDVATRVSAVERLGQARKPEHRSLLEGRQAVEKSAAVKDALEVALAMYDLSSEQTAQQVSAARVFQAKHSLAGATELKALLERAQKEPGSINPEVVAAATSAVLSIERHFAIANFVGTLFRGLSLGSVLLIMALGLAITFGLMGVINMAHGELMVVGAYTTYLVQSLFIGWFGKGGAGFSTYFVFALPASFLGAALVGLLLE
ncbi:MAG TPA: urea ABC transporter permease subunit UrtB, partial [Opitutaceae bacterium]|nr:urea ABC transporter permease subunit UrtB [Opitutaceae bacterium]